MLDSININKMRKVNFTKRNMIAIAICLTGLVMVSCGGGNSSKQGSTAKTLESKEQAVPAKEIVPDKPKIEGIFGEYGLTDKDIVLDGATFEPDAGYNEAHKGKRIMAMATFPNWDEAAGKAAWPGFVEKLKKAVAGIDDSGDPTPVDDTNKRWSSYYNYGGKKARIVATQMGATIQLEIYWA
jgi:hypothetical protein